MKSVEKNLNLLSNSQSEKEKLSKTKSDSVSKITQSNSNKSAKSPDDVEVLYQRLGTKWYAFSVVEEEVFFSTVPDFVIGNHEQIVLDQAGAATASRSKSVRGNS